MIPKIEDVEIHSGYAMIEPKRANSEIVRSEKKYDRHSFGKVLKLGINTDEGFLLGKNVFYDDTNAIPGAVEVNRVSFGENPREINIVRRTAQVEFVPVGSVVAYFGEDEEEEE